MKKGGFDRIAPYYDDLSRLVFGGLLQKAQRVYLPEVPCNAKVLIIGGGTGWLLKDLVTLNSGCEITYLEASKRMIDLSQRRLDAVENRRVSFVLDKDLQNIEPQNFEVVICHFFLDLYQGDELLQVVSQLKERLLPGGQFLFCDFQKTGKWQHQFLEKIMYWCFRLVCGIRSRMLVDYNQCLLESGLTLKRETTFYQGMITSKVYTN